ncbi:MAG: zinc chelation protein SecC [Oleibacter sp.]|nr:zinc chelation protein SecC [Thalassolituus sp.]
MTLCPCGSGLDFAVCCGLLHNGQPASSPEALMRSRYSAFVMGNTDYLLRSWAQENRPAELVADDTQWCGLEIYDASEQGNEGRVRFAARFRDQDGYQELTETSRFRRDDDGFWRYVDGDAQFRRWQPGRNDNCPCGSGKKFKKCCG